MVTGTKISALEEGEKKLSARLGGKKSTAPQLFSLPSLLLPAFSSLTGESFARASLDCL
jgi:hypothetical protein